MPRLVDQIFKFYKKEFTLTISVKTANGYTGQYNNHKHGRYFIYLLVASSLRPFPFRELEVRDLHYKDPALQWKILWIRVQ